MSQHTIDLTDACTTADDALRRLATSLVVITDGIALARSRAYDAGGLPNAGRFDSALDRQRVTRLIAARMRGLGLGHLLDEEAVDARGEEWVAELQSIITRVVL